MTIAPYGGMIIKNTATNLVLYNNGTTSVSLVAAKSMSDADFWNTCWRVTDTYVPLDDFEIPAELLYYPYNNAVATVQLSLVLDGGEDDWTSNRDFTWSVSNSTFSITSSYSSSGLLTTYQYGGVTNIIVTHKSTGVSKSFRFVCGVLREDTYYLIQNKGSGKYMEITDGSTQDGALVQQMELHNGTHAQFKVRMSSPSTYYIQVFHSDKYLQLQNSSTAVGAKFEQDSYDADVSERWVIYKTTSGAYRIMPALTYSQGYAAVIPSSSNQNGTDLVQQSYTADTNYYDEWVFTRLLPLSGYEKDYDPDSWNSDGSAPITNCYGYALNVQYMPYIIDNQYQYVPQDMQPGEKSDTIPTAITASEILRCVQNDSYALGFTFQPIGKYEKCPEGTYKVALVVDSDNDYHWYRQDSNHFWSSKHGVGGSCNGKDGSGNLIFDPELADHTYDWVDEYGNVVEEDYLNYDVFVGYYAVSPLNNTKDILEDKNLTIVEMFQYREDEYGNIWVLVYYGEMVYWIP